MNILCFDTSSSNLSVALGKDAATVVSRNFSLGHRLSDNLHAKLESVLQLKKLAWKDVDAFIVGTGPGSFTSLRVGVASVQGLAFALGKPAVGVCSLEALALAAGDHPSIWVINDARRHLLYAGHYAVKDGRLKILDKPALLTFEELSARFREKSLFVGSGVALYRKELNRLKWAEKLLTDKEPQAKYLLPLGCALLKKKRKSPVLPLYLYPEDCQVRR